jgi:hypothetical protein
MDDPARMSGPLSSWKATLVDDLERVALRDRWGLALMAVGWVHLGFFLVCQALFWKGDLYKPHYLALWGGEFVVNLWVIRRVAGRGWHRATPLAGVLVRVWATFLILSFNVASLNTLTGFTLDWFKPVWGTLSTFGFATTAYLVNPWFFVPAVQMYFTGLVMVRFPDDNYLIYGLSWWVSLQGIGLILERRRRRGTATVAGEREDAETASAAA